MNGLTKQEKTDVDERLRELGIPTITAFQRINGLRVDGIVGPKTKKALWPEHIDGRDDLYATTAPGIASSAQWPYQADCEKYYGTVGQNQVQLSLPYSMKLAWDKRVPIQKFSCHMKVSNPLRAIFEGVMREYDKVTRATLGLDLFGGCLNVRKMRGGSSWSMHSWGIAVDMDPARNILHSTRLRTFKDSRGIVHPHARMSDPEYNAYWKIVEAEGAISLGRARDFDWMHFQFARL